MKCVIIERSVYEMHFKSGPHGGPPIGERATLYEYQKQMNKWKNE